MRRGTLRAVVIRPRLIVDAAAAAIDSALDGYGITRVMSYQVAADVAANRLVLTLQAYEPPPIPVHLVMQADRPITAEPRAFIDFAASSLRGGLDLVDRSTNPWLVPRTSHPDRSMATDRSMDPRLRGFFNWLVQAFADVQDTSWVRTPNVFSDGRGRRNRLMLLIRRKAFRQKRRRSATTSARLLPITRHLGRNPKHRKPY